jgi:hypothetical protein
MFLRLVEAFDILTEIYTDNNRIVCKTKGSRFHVAQSQCGKY